MNKWMWRLQHLLKGFKLEVVFFCILNTLLLLVIFQNIRVALFFSIAGFLFCFSYAGQQTLCYIFGCFDIKPAYRTQILPIVAEVYAAAKRKNPELPDRINVKFINDLNPIVYAAGRNTICITFGMIGCPEYELIGLTAHAMGHFAMQHTVIPSLICCGNPLMTILMALWEFSDRIKDATVLSPFQECAANAVHWILTGPIILWIKLCSTLLMRSGPLNDCKADQYAADIGCGKYLMDILRKDLKCVPSNLILKMLAATGADHGLRRLSLRH